VGAVGQAHLAFLLCWSCVGRVHAASLQSASAVMHHMIACRRFVVCNSCPACGTSLTCMAFLCLAQLLQWLSFASFSSRVVVTNCLHAEEAAVHVTCSTALFAVLPHVT
jgi:hypothetical protein